MDAINKLWNQAAELFRSLSPGGRLLAGLLTAVLVVGLAWLLNREVGGEDYYLLGGQGFSANELPAMEAAFGKAGLNDYEVVGNRIRIPRGKQGEYMAALADAQALPAHYGDMLARALANQSPFASRAQQEAALAAAIERELSLMLSKMQGIAEANVKCTAEKRGLGPRGERKVTALVSIKPIGNAPLDESRVPHIQRAVAGGWAGLAPQDVVVLDQNSGISYGGSSGLSGSLDNPHLLAVKHYTELYESQMHKALRYIPGVTITALVELNPELEHREERNKVDPKTVPLYLREDTTLSTQEKDQPGGRPGFESQQPNRGASIASGRQGSRSEEETSAREEQNAVSHDRTLVTMAGLTPKRVTVSIGVPTSYLLRVWREKQPTAPGQPPKDPTPAELEAVGEAEALRIRNSVASLLPNVDATVDPRPLVQVTTFPDVKLEEPPGLSLAEQALHWLGASWQTLAMLALVIFSLAVVRSLARGGPATAPLPAPALAAPEAGQPETAGAASPQAETQARRRFQSGQSLRDELAEMVRENPDAAAGILRTWIGAPN
jgi:flagellar M-ring protein FliF